MDVDPEDLGVEEDGAHVDLDSQRKGKTNLKYSPLDIRTKLKSKFPSANIQLEQYLICISFKI